MIAEISLESLLRQPLIPRADNFTPPERTPWGGREIIRRYKSHLGIATESIVGESWEISAHPSFPNIISTPDGDVPIADIATRDPAAFYGARFRGEMPFLVKILNSGTDPRQGNLSVQVHPPKNRFPHHPSKAEGWVILDAEPGAGIYLGLRAGVTRDVFAQALRQGENIASLMNFVEVRTGDIFHIPPGTLHAIGAGVLLVEPQENSESTFRVYDWNRGRPLHIEEALRATDWESPRGEALVATLKKEATENTASGVASASLLEIPEFCHRRLTFLERGARHRGNTSETGLQGFLCLEGAVEIATEEKNATCAKGQACLIPAAVGAFEIAACSEKAVLLQTFVR